VRRYYGVISEQMPEPEKIHQMLVAAHALASDLEREIVQLELGKRFGTQLKQVYDTVYLPIALSLAAGLNAFDIPDSEILREPLIANPELSATQLRVVLEILHSAVLMLSEN
jgi:hypothetical protein